MNNFKVGDRVKVNKDVMFALKKGMTGTVVGFSYYHALKNSPLVEFDKNFDVGHDGGYMGANGKQGHCWYCQLGDIDLINQSNQSIHIYPNGNTTTAVVKENGKVVKKAIAKCSPEDAYAFEIGARIAFDRLYDRVDESCETPKVVEVKRQAKVGEYIKIVESYSWLDDYKNGDIFKVVEHAYDEENSKGVFININNENVYVSGVEYVVLEGYSPKEVINNICNPMLKTSGATSKAVNTLIKTTESTTKTEVKKTPEFNPYLLATWALCSNNENVGYIGEETSIIDLVGNKLKVGDTVTFYYNNENRGESVICKENSYPHGYVSGLASLHFTTGRSDGWSIIKKRSYQDIIDTEFIDTVEYVRSQK